MHSQVFWPQVIDNDFRTFVIFFTVSTICHVVFFGMLIVVPAFKMERTSTLSVINVSMVTLPASEKTPEPAGRPKIETRKQKITPKTLQTSKGYQKQTSAVSTAPKHKIKTSLKKKTFKSSKMVKRAISRIEKKVEEARPDQIIQAIDRLKDKVGKTGELEKQKQNAVKGPAIPGDSQPGRKRALELLDIYRIEVAYRIQKNWAFSEQLAGGRTDLVAELAFTIMPDGEIRDIWFDKRSGNSYLDESAHKAILKSNPVRPHPKGVVRPVVTVGLRFTPKGVK